MSTIHYCFSSADVVWIVCIVLYLPIYNNPFSTASLLQLLYHILGILPTFLGLPLLTPYIFIFWAFFIVLILRATLDHYLCLTLIWLACLSLRRLLQLDNRSVLVALLRLHTTPVVCVPRMALNTQLNSFLRNTTAVKHSYIPKIKVFLWGSGGAESPPALGP